MVYSMPGFPVHHQLPELAQSHVHRIGDAIQPFHPLLPPSFAFNLSQHQCLFQSVGSSHQVTKVLELQLQHQHQSFQRALSVCDTRAVGCSSFLLLPPLSIGRVHLTRDLLSSCWILPEQSKLVSLWHQGLILGFTF